MFWASEEKGGPVTRACFRRGGEKKKGKRVMGKRKKKKGEGLPIFWREKRKKGGEVVGWHLATGGGGKKEGLEGRGTAGP